MITSFDHVHIYSADAPSSVAFYCETLGAESIGAIANGRGGENHLILLGGQFLAISDFPPGLEASTPPEHGDGALAGFGVAHIGLNVEAFEPVLERLASVGIVPHSEVRSAGALQYVYFTAPDGVVVELTRYVLPAAARPAAATLRLLNRAIHRARVAIGRGLVRAAANASSVRR